MSRRLGDRSARSRSLAPSAAESTSIWHGTSAPEADALLFTAPKGGPLFRGTFARDSWRPALKRAALGGLTFHGLRHSFVAILVDAGCNVREVSEWAGHSSVASTLTRYGGLFEDGSDDAVDRLDKLLGGPDQNADEGNAAGPRAEDGP
jgi:integrase